jgi:type I restriction enzyme S subunit
MDAVARAAENDDAVEGPWALPEGWCWAEARSFADVVGGGTPSDAADPANFDVDGVPWITPADLSGYSGSTIHKGSRSLSPTGFQRSSTQMLPAGSVLISSRAPVGYCVVAEVPVCTNQGFKSLRLKGSIDPYFIRYFVLYAKRRLNDAASGTTFKELSGRAMEQILFPLAPLAEQRRIVARVDTLFAEIAEGEAALAEVCKGLDTFRRALLKAAVTGELTKDWRSENPATETGHDLLVRIAKARVTKASANGRGRHNADKPPLATTRPDLPAGWVWATLGEMFDVSTGSTPSRSNPTLWNGGIPWVSSGEVAFCRIRTTKETISMAGLGNPATRLNPAGTVLLAMIGEGKTRGQCAILDVPAANNQNAAAIRVSATPIPPEFVYQVLEERYLRSRRESQGGNQPALNGGKVAEMAIPLPPLHEIAEILRRVSHARSAIADALSILDAQAADVARLKQSILKAAFEGRLVPQESADEPARTLLARLAANSPALGVKRGRGRKSNA